MANEQGIFRVSGASALLGAAAAIAGAAVGAIHQLGGQNLPLGGNKELLFLAANRQPYVLRESLYLLVAIFAVGEGVGLYVLLRRAGSVVGWAIVAWMLGLCIGIVEDGIVLGVVSRLGADYAQAAPPAQAGILAVSPTIDMIIRVQQFTANALSSGVGLLLFALGGLKTKLLPGWLTAIGLAASILVGWGYGLVSLTGAGGQGALMATESAFGLLVVWDVAVGIILLRRRDT